MKTEQRLYIQDEWSNQDVNNSAQLVLAFASSSLVKEETSYKSLKTFYPNADIVLTSTAGEIFDTEVNDDSISTTALTFKDTITKAVNKEVKDIGDSFLIGSELAKEVNTIWLKYILVFIDWLWINWCDFLDGIKSVLDKKVWITWWLAWDGFNPHKTYVSLNKKTDEKKMAVIVWFYGDSIKIWNASLAGFNTFGIERKITKSKGNIVYELDGEPMLKLYKKYLWKQAEKLPGSAVNFPLSISKQWEEDWLLRSILTVDEKTWSVTFSWNVTQWYRAFLMRTDLSSLIKEAWKAATLAMIKNPDPQFALLISCAGRRIILKQRVEDEIDDIRWIVWEDCTIAWFYSYGEIWISTWDISYELHNETMTVALFSES